MNLRSERDRQSCDACWFFMDGEPDSGVGECHRSSPRPIVQPYREVSHPERNSDWDWPDWPRVEHGDWCGEFQEMIEDDVADE